MAGSESTGRVLVVGPYLRERRGDAEAAAYAHIRDTDARLEEAVGLARAIDLDVIEAIPAPLSQIRPATYLGKGKVEEIAGVIAANEIGIVVMDCALSQVGS